MASLLALLRGRTEQRYGLDQWAADKAEWFSFLGNGYGGVSFTQTGAAQESPDNSFLGYVHGAYKSSGVVFACSLARMMAFAEARFQWQQLRRGRPQDLFGNTDLTILERPWPNGTTGELLARAMQDTDLAGNFYVLNEGDRLRRLRPDWTAIILSAPPDEAVASDVVGYAYWPGGDTAKQAEVWPASQVAHWSPIPDPEAQYRGMSWMTPVVRDLMADKAATAHKLKFFENAATPNLAVKLPDTVTLEQFQEFKDAMNSEHRGVNDAYKTLFLGGGADVTVVGTDLRQLDFKDTQGAGETRIAAAAGVPPVIVGLSEGLAGSSLNAGNFSAARRRFADITIRPMWRSMAASLETIVPPPLNTRLWYDDRDIPFLREDAKDAAEIEQIKASTIRQLIDGGFEPESVVDAVDAADMTLLVHSGLPSVQLQPSQSNGQQPVPVPAE